MNPLDKALLDKKITRYQVERNYRGVQVSIENIIGQNRYCKSLIIEHAEILYSRFELENTVNSRLENFLKQFLHEVDETEKNPV